MTTAVLAEPTTGFRSLGLNDSLLSVLERVGYHKPTPIQAALIPHALQGRDVLGQAQTGTGKTAAFLLPFLNDWSKRVTHGPEMLIMAPTRELVVQVAEEARKLVPSKLCTVLPIYGGQRIGGQLRSLEDGVTIAVGTPGRVIDHLLRGTLNLQSLRFVVLDEADRMLDIGFRPSIEKILRRCPSQRQTLLLSATMPAPVLRLVHRYMIDPVQINLSPDKLTVDKIRQTYFTVDEDRKFPLLLKVLRREKPRQAIIFVERKRGAEALYKKLYPYCSRTAVMHGDLPQEKRNRIMQSFRTGEVALLVATDVVGRGIDVQNISHIFNYDLPHDPENYVHRIGRTGRMGAHGIAIGFVTPEQGELLTTIEGFINHILIRDNIPDFEAFRPREKAADGQPPVERQPVFGRIIRKYSNRL